MIPTKVSQRLEKFRNRLKELDPQETEEINMFTAFNLQNAERHHSSFFAGLLAPGNPHHMGDAAIKKFLYYLWDDTVREEDYKHRNGNSVTIKSLPNTEILRTVAQDRQSLINLAEGDITVSTEVSINNNSKSTQKGFIDILVKICEKKEEAASSEKEASTEKVVPTVVNTVIVIENKTGTETHSDQLRKYENYIDAVYPDSKKIFVLLSPRGSIPINRGGNEQYNNRYCIFDYSQGQGVCKILEELIAELDLPPMKVEMTSKQRRKIKMILEDYKDMVQKNILANDPGLRKEIKNLFEEFPDITSLIVNYYDNVHDLLDYAEVYFSQQLQGFRVISRNANSMSFSTAALDEYYSQKQEKATTSSAYLISTDSASEIKYFIQAKYPKQTGDPSRSGSIEKWEQRGEKIEGQIELEINIKLAKFRDTILYYENKFAVNTLAQPNSSKQS